MPIRDFLAIIYTTILTISALHMPQPLLPLLGNSFNVEMDTISLIMSATFIPLTFIPVISGILLNFFIAKKDDPSCCDSTLFGCIFNINGSKCFVSYISKIYRGFF